MDLSSSFDVLDSEQETTSACSPSLILFDQRCISDSTLILLQTTIGSTDQCLDLDVTASNTPGEAKSTFHSEYLELSDVSDLNSQTLEELPFHSTPRKRQRVSLELEDPIPPSDSEK